MVTVKEYQKRKNAEGMEFFTLTLIGDVQFRLSKNGAYYATAFKGSITTTFNEETCKGLVGRTFPGQIERIDCEPYEFTLPNNDTIILNFRYRFNPTQKQQSMEEAVFSPEPVTVGV